MENIERKYSITVEIADVPFELRCRFAENPQYLQDYQTEKEPSFIIEPTDSDLARAQYEYSRIVEAEGMRSQIYPAPFLENYAIHSLLAEQMTKHHVLLVHGSALCMDGQAYIFMAPSGTGKSTHAGLWRELFGNRVWMINDDKPMVRVFESEIRVYGTPWDGKHHLSRNASAPLKAAVLLSRGEDNRIDRLSKADSFRVLLKQAYVSGRPDIMQNIVGLDKEIAERTEFYHLVCNIQPEAARVAWEGINKGIPR